MALNRQEKALREFKQIMADLVQLLRASTHVPLVYLCWVNETRRQFVWETNSTTLSNVMFKDRLDFEDHFLNSYKNITEITYLLVGEDLERAQLTHYLDKTEIRSLILVPFINKGATVALTVLESEELIDLEQLYDSIQAYNNAMVNVLATYLEVVDLHEQQKEWEEYEQSLEALNYRMHRVKILQTMLNEMQKYLPGGSVALLCHGMNTWNVVLNSEGSVHPFLIGLKMDDKSISSEALMRGNPFFSMHFNNSPKRISAGEGLTTGASLVIPVSMFDRRQALILASHENPLSFKEAVKHKLINLVRTAGLNIQASVKKSSMSENLLTHSYDAYIPELWEAVLEVEIKKFKPSGKIKTYFGLISPDDVPALRTKFGLEELQSIQEDFVRILNPSIYGVPGFIGFNSDYVYAVIIQGESDDIVEQWFEKLNLRLQKGIKLSNGYSIDLNFKTGFTVIDESSTNAYQVITKAKRAHSESVTDKEKKLVIRNG